MFKMRPSVVQSPVLFFFFGLFLNCYTEFRNNFVVMKIIQCTFSYSQESLIQFFSGNYAPFEHRKLAKSKYITAGLLKAAQPNFRKLFNLKDIQSRCACSQKILNQFFSYGIMPLLIIEIWQKLNILLKQFSSATPLKPLHKTSCYFIVKVDILCICAYLREILIWFFFLENILIVKIYHFI